MRIYVCWADIARIENMIIRFIDKFYYYLYTKENIRMSYNSY